MSNLLPLDTLRELISYNPFHFWQLANKLVPITDSCNTILRKYAWQARQAAGRAELEEKIGLAEQRLKEYLGYSVAPHWVTETLDVGCYRQLLWGRGLLTLQEGKVRQVGTLAISQIGEGAADLSDSDHDGLDDTFTALISDSTTSPADVRIYFAAADRYDDSQDLDYWEIRPVKVTRLNATTLQAVGRSWLLVKPYRYDGVGNPVGYNPDLTGLNSSGALDPSDPDTYVANVAFYKRTISATGVATLTNDTAGTITSYTLSAEIGNHETGQVLVQPQPGQGIPCFCGCGWNWNWPWGFGIFGFYPSGQPCYTQPVQQVTISYEAGADIANWKTIITRLALAELMRAICACEDANKEVYRWQQDLARVGTSNGIGSGESFRVDTKALANFFGTRAGQVDAWRQVRNLRLGTSVNV
jgi:hypothetical protein